MSKIKFFMRKTILLGGFLFCNFSPTYGKGFFNQVKCFAKAKPVAAYLAAFGAAAVGLTTGVLGTRAVLAKRRQRNKAELSAAATLGVAMLGASAVGQQRTVRQSFRVLPVVEPIAPALPISPFPFQVAEGSIPALLLVDALVLSDHQVRAISSAEASSDQPVTEDRDVDSSEHSTPSHSPEGDPENPAPSLPGLRVSLDRGVPGGVTTNGTPMGQGPIQDFLLPFLLDSIATPVGPSVEGSGVKQGDADNLSNSPTTSAAEETLGGPGSSRSPSPRVPCPRNVLSRLRRMNRAMSLLERRGVGVGQETSPRQLSIEQPTISPRLAERSPSLALATDASSRPLSPSPRAPGQGSVGEISLSGPSSSSSSGSAYSTSQEGVSSSEPPLYGDFVQLKKGVVYDPRHPSISQARQFKDHQTRILESLDDCKLVFNDNFIVITLVKSGAEQTYDFLHTNLFNVDESGTVPKALILESLIKTLDQAPRIFRTLPPDLSSKGLELDPAVLPKQTLLKSLDPNATKPAVRLSVATEAIQDN